MNVDEEMLEEKCQRGGNGRMPQEHENGRCSSDSRATPGRDDGRSDRWCGTTSTEDQERDDVEYQTRDTDDMV